ncbi:replication factor C subunit 4 [Sorochytrium milnesiophthora]
MNGDAGSSAPHNVGELELPWCVPLDHASRRDTHENGRVEKYRPVELKDVVGNEETVSRLQVIAQQGNMPNIILSGAPGIGKTTSILCLARALLGSAAKEAVLELNASDDRGIDVVRNRIKMFAQKKVTLPPGRHKIVILDEADSMTSGAQQALRRTMELFSSTTRFALACNLSSKIIEPIQSRCAMLRYSRVTNLQMLKRLREVAEAEQLQYTPEGFEALIFSAEGDMRQAINNLQSTAAGFGLINADNVFKVCDQPHPHIVQQIVWDCVGNDIDGANDGLRDLWRKGYSALDVITTLSRVVKNWRTDGNAEPGKPSDDGSDGIGNASTFGPVAEYVKLEYLKEIGMCHMRVVEGTQSLLQLSGLLARLCRVSMDPKVFEL